MRKRSILRSLTAAAVLALSVVATAGPSGAAPAAEPAPLPPRPYIVTMKPGVAPVKTTAKAQLGRVKPSGEPTQVFTHAIRGYTADLTPAQAIELAAQPGVLAVEPDGIVHTMGTQPSAPWGLDRIDQQNLPLSTTYTYGPTGAGVTAYIVDTGIRTTHQDFGGRAASGYDAIDGGTADDCNGHGTHVASTVGGSAYGVAKGVRLVAVRVLDCQGSGTNSQVIAGMDWVVAQHQAGQPAVVNMSLGGSANTATDQAIARLTADGVAVAVAAGNSSADACSSSPARAPSAITVAASDRTDRLASFSNVGSCVDVIAPGVDITAAWNTSDTATNTISGTSMASPHTAGAAAKVLQAAPSATPAQVASTIRSSATANRVSGTAASCAFWIFFCKPATPNYLLFSS